MGLKTSASPKQISLDLPVANSVERSFLVKLIVDFITFLLYEQHQIPEPVHLLRRNNERQKTLRKSSNSRSIQTSRSQQCVAKFLDTLSQIQQVLLGALVANDVTEFVMVFGATPLSAKDIYKVDLSQFITEDKSSKCCLQKMTLCSRELCVKLMQNEEFFNDNKGLTSIFLFVKAKAKAAMKGWQAWPQFKIPEKKLRLVVSLQPSVEKQRKFDERMQNKENNPQRQDPMVQKNHVNHMENKDETKGAKSKACMSQRCPNMKPRKLLYDVIEKSNAENEGCSPTKNLKPSVEKNTEPEIAEVSSSKLQSSHKSAMSALTVPTLSEKSAESCFENIKAVVSDELNCEETTRGTTSNKESPALCVRSSTLPSNSTLFQENSKTDEMTIKETSNGCQAQFVYFKMSLNLKGFK